MNRMRFSIATLLAWVALLGVGIAALRSGSPLWGSVLFSLAIGTLTVAVLAAVYRRGRRRAFWVGFASCGWVYLLLALGPGNESLAGPFLVTTTVLDLLYPKVVPPPPAGPFIPTPPRSRWEVWTETSRVTDFGTTVGGVSLFMPEPFRRIGHSLFCLLGALTGGSLTRYLYSTREG